MEGKRNRKENNIFYFQNSSLVVDTIIFSETCLINYRLIEGSIPLPLISQ